MSRVLASSAFRGAPHAVVYVHCSKLREVDTTAVLEAAMADRKRCAALLPLAYIGHSSAQLQGTPAACSPAGGPCCRRSTVLHTPSLLMPCRRLYVPRVQDRDANMHFLHLDGWGALQEVPPFGIREPRPEYEDGMPRQDVLEVCLFVAAAAAGGDSHTGCGLWDEQNLLQGGPARQQGHAVASRSARLAATGASPLRQATAPCRHLVPATCPSIPNLPFPSHLHVHKQVDEPLELVVMPGLAFDRTGRRLGRGGGYYDKFLHAARARAAQRCWAPPLLVALSYRSQLVDRVPVEPHDVGVDAIVTPDEVVVCTAAGAAALPPTAPL